MSEYPLVVRIFKTSQKGKAQVQRTELNIAIIAMFAGSVPCANVKVT